MRKENEIELSIPRPNEKLLVDKSRVEGIPEDIVFSTMLFEITKDDLNSIEYWRRQLANHSGVIEKLENGCRVFLDSRNKFVTLKPENMDNTDSGK